MKEQLKKILDSIKAFWTGLSKKMKIIIIASVVAVIALAVILSVTSKPEIEYVMIYDDLPQKEVTEILNALSDSEIDVRVVDGDGIEVPEKDEAAVRMALATAGYPKNGLSYYLIEENSNMLTTDYERRQYQTLQLQERLGASIETISGVKQAIVTLALSEESVFYLTEATEPTASVVVDLKEDVELTDSQIEGIRNLVASAVPGLTTENVTMTDGYGNALVVSDEETTADNKRSKLANEVESAIKKKVEHVLEGPYGKDHFKVSVAATIDTDKYTREEITYYPSDPAGTGNNTGVVDEETHATEGYSSTDTDGGVPGTSTNADVVEYPTQTGGSSSSSSSTSDNIKYDVSYVRTLLDKNGAYIEDLSVGVVVDKNSFDDGERENLAELVAYAAGVPLDSVTVQSFKFFEEEEPEVVVEEGLGMWLYIIIGGVLLLIIAGLVVFMILRNKRKKAEAEALAEAERLEQERLLNEQFGEVEGEESTPKPITEKIEKVENGIVNEIKEFTLSNPEVAAQMIKTWLRADEER